ncbi:hypothetical protein P171DRAFT_147312 [Karstenula rhodostoma CBS 690.94]|uniref:Uncharacterized protein n=1 Tax=Karstenula rhodostoma CBS 690.94 TaxID=1392251 RepID=A0A9P4PUT9_9PLEO|nr:hypothetical protein P171DRAFT_147312 [Karstenula rhodostoma CBS 690.94]
MADTHLCKLHFLLQTSRHTPLQWYFWASESIPQLSSTEEQTGDCEISRPTLLRTSLALSTYSLPGRILGSRRRINRLHYNCYQIWLRETSLECRGDGDHGLLPVGLLMTLVSLYIVASIIRTAFVAQIKTTQTLRGARLESVCF